MQNCPSFAHAAPAAAGLALHFNTIFMMELNLNLRLFAAIQSPKTVGIPYSENPKLYSSSILSIQI
jgi:hypothetical protein